MKKILLPFACHIFLGNCFAQDLEAFEFTKDWLAKIETKVPSKTSVAVK